ncbi:MAG: hypothetical protein WAQ27_05520 [Candidatus Microsaccharimonas sp.]
MHISEVENLHFRVDVIESLVNMVTKDELKVILKTEFNHFAAQFATKQDVRDIIQETVPQMLEKVVNQAFERHLPNQAT